MESMLNNFLFRRLTHKKQLPVMAEIVAVVVIAVTVLVVVVVVVAGPLLARYGGEAVPKH